MVCLRRPYHFKFFKGCLPQILLSPFLSTLSDMIVHGNSDPCLTIKHFQEALQPESQLCTGWSFCWIRFKRSNILMKNYRLVPEGHQYLKVSNIWNCRCYLFSNEPKKNKKKYKNTSLLLIRVSDSWYSAFQSLGIFELEQIFFVVTKCWNTNFLVIKLNQIKWQ